MLVLLALALVAPSAAAPQVKPPAPQQPTGRDAAASPRPAGTGMISGTLVAADTARPVRRARVVLTEVDRSNVVSVTTDDQGRFSFTGLPASRFNLSASKAGYLDSVFGQKRPGSGRAGTPISLTEAQRLENVKLQIARGGVITGVILDEQGEPAFGTPVRALRYVMRTGERILQPAGTATADDRGVYRIPALPPGEYIVTAVPRDAAGVEMAMAEAKMQVAQLGFRSMDSTVVEDVKKTLDSITQRMGNPADDQTSGYAPVYYPGTTMAASASSVTLGVSEERSNIDVSLQLVPMGRVSGTLTSADGQTPPAAQITLVDTTGSLPGLASRVTRPGPDGRFSFAGVPPGQYTAIARAMVGSPVALKVAADRLGAPAGVVMLNGMPATNVMVGASSGQPPQVLWGMTDVSTDGRGISNVTLTLQPAMTVSGRVAFDGASPPTDLTKVRLSLQPVGQTGPGVELGSTVAPAQVDAEGRFTFSGVVPGRYRISSALSAPGWSVKSSVVEGRDSLDFPFEVKPNENVAAAVVTFGNRSTELSGVLQDPAGRPTSDFTVIVFAAENRFWTPMSRRIQATRPGTDGRFVLRDLPPGDYRLTAVVDVEPGQWFDPAFLRQTLAVSMPVSLTEGERKTQDVRVR